LAASQVSGLLLGLFEIEFSLAYFFNTLAAASVPRLCAISCNLFPKTMFILYQIF
jgi:hypothetical protein